jgi:hypothetical protein
VGVLNKRMILILEISCFEVSPDSAHRRYKSGNTVGLDLLSAILTWEMTETDLSTVQKSISKILYINHCFEKVK